MLDVRHWLFGKRRAYLAVIFPLACGMYKSDSPVGGVGLMADVDSALDERGGCTDFAGGGSSPLTEKSYTALSMSALDKARS